MIDKLVPNVTFKTRISNGDNTSFRWEEVSSSDLFSERRVVLFSLPGAFTPTCSTFQLPEYENAYDVIVSKKIDSIHCISVNDAFVMNAWGEALNIKDVQLIPDGSGEFTRKMGMLVAKENVGFGMRSWRYAAVLENGRVEAWFEEPGYSDNCAEDPYGESSPENIIRYLTP